MSETGIVLTLVCLFGSLAGDLAGWRTQRPHSADLMRMPATMLASRGMQRTGLLLAATALMVLAGGSLISFSIGMAGLSGAAVASAVARARHSDRSTLRAQAMVYLGLGLVLLAYMLNGTLQGPGAAGDLRPMQAVCAGVLLQQAMQRKTFSAPGLLPLFMLCVSSVSLSMLFSSLRMPGFVSACVLPLVLASAASLATVLALLCEHRALPAIWRRIPHAPAFLLAALFAGAASHWLVFSMLVGNHAAPDGTSYPLAHLWWAFLLGEILAAAVLAAWQRRAARDCTTLLGAVMVFALLLALLCAGSLGLLLTVIGALALALPWISVV